MIAIPYSETAVTLASTTGERHIFPSCDSWKVQGSQHSESAPSRYRYEQQIASTRFDHRATLNYTQESVLPSVPEYPLRAFNLITDTAAKSKYEPLPRIGAIAWGEAEAIRNPSSELSSIFALAEWEDFEDGVETEFSRRIEGFVRQYSVAGINAIRKAVAEKVYFEQDVAEALLWIGLMRDSSSARSRRDLLVFALDSESVFIRDSAVSALSYLADTSVIKALSRRLDDETSEGIKSNIRSVLRYLRRLK